MLFSKIFNTFSFLSSSCCMNAIKELFQYSKIDDLGIDVEDIIDVSDEAVDKLM